MSTTTSASDKNITNSSVERDLESKKGEYTTTIGIEVHAELKTKTKMFCNSKNDPHASEPNVHVCPVCMAHPGTLPVINKEAVQHVLKVGVALNAKLAEYTEFDRKNYFYPDIPKGYQISQYLFPLVSGGELAGVSITRVHLEEDTARSLHDQGDGSVIDYNRAGVPLMELVTEPVIHDAKTAGNFAKELQLLLRTLQVSDANMEKGEMRVEANISVSKTDTFGTKVEVKNLNSFKSVESAIEYEVKRQIELLEKGDMVIQETRGWDENKSKTFSQRIKESADDYRYFPDPDLPSLNLGVAEEFFLSRIEVMMPILPLEKRIKYSDIGIPREQIEVLISSFEADTFFASLLNLKPNCTNDFLKLSVNYITSDIFGLIVSNPSDYSFGTAHVDTFISLMEMLHANEINSRVAKDLIPEVVFAGSDPCILAKDRGLLQQSSSDDLLPIVKQVITENSSVVDEYKSGKVSVLQFFVGQGMKLTKGSANPAVLAELFKDELS